MSIAAGSYRFLTPLAIFGVLVIVFAVGIKHSPEVGVISSPLVGKAAPQWELPTLTDGSRKIGSQSLRGQWYVLNVWGTWCPTCEAEHGALLEIKRMSPVPIIGIDWRDDDAQAFEYLARVGNPYSTVAVDHDGHTVIDFGVSAAPETFLVSDAGVIVYKHIGEMTPQVWQTQFAARLPAKEGR